MLYRPVKGLQGEKEQKKIMMNQFSSIPAEFDRGHLPIGFHDDLFLVFWRLEAHEAC